MVIVPGAASASLAKDPVGPSTINIQKTSHQNIAAPQTLLGADILRSEDVYMTNEQSARDQVVKDWPSLPGAAQVAVRQPQEQPGYLEWLTCIEMTPDVLQMRARRARPTPSAPGSPSRA